MRRFLLCTALALPLPATAQTDDRSYLTAFLEDNLSGAGRKVTVTGFEGALSSKATIASLTIADDRGIWLTLNGVALDWNRAALFGGQVSVNALTAEEIILERPPLADDSALPTPEAKGFSLPELPVSVEIGQVSATRLVLGESVLGTALEGRLTAALSLSGGEGSASLTLERTDDGPDGSVTLQASYANTSGDLAIDLQAREDAGGIAATLLGLPGAPDVALSVQGEGPISDYTADVLLESDGEDRLAGTVTLLANDAGGQGFAADLGGDLAPLFVPEYAEFFGPDVRLQTQGVRHADGRLDLAALSVQTKALQLDGALSLAADGLPTRFALNGALGLDGQPVILPLTTDQKTAVTHADLSLAFDVAKGNGWKGAVSLTGLQRDDFAADALQIIGSGRIDRSVGGSGRASLGGTLTYTAQRLAPRDPALATALGTAIGGAVTLVLQDGVDGLSLPRFTLQGDGYGLTGGARIEGLQSALAVSGQATAQFSDLGRLSALAGRKLAGGASATVSGKAALLAGSFDIAAQITGQDLQLDQPEADNLLQGTSTIDLSVIRDESGTLLRQLDVVAQSLTAKGSGRISSSGSDVVADVNFADLAVLGSKYRGALVGKARFSGTPDKGDLTLDAKGDGIAIGVAEVDALLRGPSTITLDAGLAGDTVDLRGLRVTAATLAATANGTLNPKGHDLRLEAQLTDLRALGGAYRGAAFGTAQFKGTDQDGKLTLQAQADGLAIGQAEADTLLRGKTAINADLRMKDGRITINTATLNNPQLRAEASGAIAGTTRQVDLTARLANLGLLLPDFPGAVSVSGSAVEDTQGYTLNLSGTGPGQLNAKVAGQIARNFGTADLALTGAAQAGLANAFIDPRTVSGPVRFDLQLNGPVAPQSLSGKISLAGGRIADASLPFSLESVNATADLAGGRMSLALDAGVSSGGSIALRGDMGLAAPFNADLAVDLQRVTLKDPMLFETRMEGRVTVNGPLAGGATIGGAIGLIETELQIPSTSLGGTGGLDGLEHQNEPATVYATRLRAGLIETASDAAGTGGGRPYPLDLTITAPNRVFLRGRGLDAELGGALQLGGTTANVVPAGAFNLIRGRLDILGKRLDLSEALLQLEGDFVPFIRILASTESEGIVSSVKIEGKATEPDVSFVSSPELPEEEVLARLLFGRGLTTLSALQAAQLASAVATLAGKGGDGIVGKLRKGFGLDDLDLVTDGDGGASVKAGKYISRNVYTEVIVGQQGQSEINLNLDITDSVTLRGSTSTEGGTGIGIFMEKDY